MPGIKIIAGRYGGRFISTPNGRATHPMSERVRGALFNSLAGVTDGANVLDVFAGSGAIGFEALSRGAASVTFIEKDRAAQRAIIDSIDKLGVADHAKLVKAAAGAWIDTYDGPKFDLIIADPPYDKMQFSTVSRILGLLKPGALMVLSHTGRGESPTLPGVVVVDNRGYGDAALTFFRLEE